MLKEGFEYITFINLRNKSNSVNFPALFTILPVLETCEEDYMSQDVGDV